MNDYQQTVDQRQAKVLKIINLKSQNIYLLRNRENLCLKVSSKSKTRLRWLLQQTVLIHFVNFEARSPID